MKKLSNQIRLSVLELLEPRTLLHGGPPPMMFAPVHEFEMDLGRRESFHANRETAIVSFSVPRDGFRQERFGASPRAESHSPLVFESRMPEYQPAAGYRTVSPSFSLPAYSPPIAIVVFVTLPQVVSVPRSLPSVMPPSRPSVDNNAAPGGGSSSHRSPVSNVSFQSQSAPSAVSSHTTVSFTGLSALSTLLTSRDLTDSVDALDSNNETPATAAENPSSPDTANERTRPTTSGEAKETIHRQAAARQDDDELIDLTTDEADERMKRKSSKLPAATRLVTPASDLHEWRGANRVEWSTSLATRWRHFDADNQGPLPANEDLIELVAEDQNVEQPTGTSLNAHAATISTQLKASLGLPAEVELLDDIAGELAEAVALDATAAVDPDAVSTAPPTSPALQAAAAR